jgi:hypothetical protein
VCGLDAAHVPYGGKRGNISLPWRKRCASLASGRARVGAIAYSDRQGGPLPALRISILDLTPGAN